MFQRKARKTQKNPAKPKIYKSCFSYPYLKWSSSICFHFLINNISHIGLVEHCTLSDNSCWWFYSNSYILLWFSAVETKWGFSSRNLIKLCWSDSGAEQISCISAVKCINANSASSLWGFPRTQQLWNGCTELMNGTPWRGSVTWSQLPHPSQHSDYSKWISHLIRFIISEYMYSIRIIRAANIVQNAFITGMKFSFLRIHYLRWQISN